jgi:hypothetical protein
MRTHSRPAIFGRLRASMLTLALMLGLAPFRRALAASGMLVAWGWHSYGGPIVLNGVGAHAIGLLGADVVGNTRASRMLSVNLAGTSSPFCRSIAAPGSACAC